MEEENRSTITFENTVAAESADIKKARLVAEILNKAKQSDEEENLGRS